MSDPTTADLCERLHEHWLGWSSPTDRDAEINEGRMAYDCNAAALALEQQAAKIAEQAARVEALEGALRGLLCMLPSHNADVDQLAPIPAGFCAVRMVDIAEARAAPKASP